MIEKGMQLFEMGGPIVIILVALSIISLTVFLFKMWQFFRLGIGAHDKANQAVDLWLQGAGQQALESLLHKNPALTSQVLRHVLQGLLFHPAKETIVREDIERVSAHLLTLAGQKIKLLEIIGQVAPLLGLFGTVIGMIDAFQAMQKAGATIDPSVLAGGIWVALLTTAVGLAVAIPSSLFANWFEARLHQEAHAVETLVTSVLTGRITTQKPSDSPHLFQGKIA